MSIRESPIIREARLPDGRVIAVRVVVPDDPYVQRSQVDTVVVELALGDAVLGVVTTPLSASDEDRAQALAERIRAELESGALDPTAEAVEMLATTAPL